MNAPLRYSISSWRQLVDVKSNNSPRLSISVTDFIQNKEIAGLRICVEHENFGPMFTCVLKARGSIVTCPGNSYYHEFTVDDILKELYKYGFYITYDPKHALTGNQLEYLMTLDKLGFDKIRLMNVVTYDGSVGTVNTYVVAFNVKENPKWIENTYTADSSGFTNAVMSGSACNLTAISKTKNYNWDWLTYVANISDIIKDNAEMSIG